MKSLALGGPADKSGLVQVTLFWFLFREKKKVGDELHEIDGINVYRKPVGDLAPLILGPVGVSKKISEEARKKSKNQALL